MVSRKQVVDAIDKAVAKFELCWATLIKVKTANLSDSADRVLNFQSDLATGLFDLNHVYTQIAREKQARIARKDTLQKDWFNSRMAMLAKYQDAIKETIAIGKSLGDSFVWPFYVENRDLLQKHQQHPDDYLMSTSFGGVSEVSFIKNVRIMHGCFVIYHGNTTLLRLGDISLYDLSLKKIIAIGEMKSKPKGDDTSQITVIFSGPEFDAMMESVHPGGKSSTKPLGLDLNPNMTERLGRQMKRIGLAFADDPHEGKIETKAFGTPYFSALEELGSKLRVGIAETQKVGDGLLLIGIKHKKSKASSRILPRRRKTFEGEFAELPETIQQSIIDSDSTDNILFYSSFYYSQRSAPYLLPGMTPLFFWKIDTDLIHKIIFKEILIVAAYNPLHFIRKLRGSGFIVKVDENDGRKIEVSKDAGDRVIGLKGFSYFISMVSRYLYPEEDVLDLIKVFTEGSKNPNIPPNSMVTLRFMQVI